MKITQKQKYLTNNVNNYIIGVSEEELQDITGGCIGCGVLTVVAGMDGPRTMASGMKNGSVEEIARGVAHTTASLITSATVSKQKLPCLNCVAQGSIYMLTKIRPK